MFRLSGFRFTKQAVAGLVLGLLVGSHGVMRGQARALITAPVDETKLTELKGNVSPMLKGAQDLGVADVSKPSGRLMLVLKRSPDQEAALQSYLQQAHETSSPNYHKWLTPTTFAQRFGAADSDVQQLSGWLQSHGLKVAGVSTGKNTIEFSGNIGQVNEAFHTSIHQYSVKGETHFANATNPSVPTALASVVAGVTQLNDFHATAQIKVAGRALFNPKTHTGKAQWTYGEGQGYAPYYFLTPEDFSTQYDVKPAYTAGVTGAGQTIGIINDSNIDLSLVNAYRKLFGLTANPPQVVIDGTDPGINGDAVEAYLDVENAGSIAPAATVKLYIAGSEGLLDNGGLNFSLLRAVNDDAATVLSLSFGECEAVGTGNNQFTNGLWEQAAAQGQTVVVSTGDSGSLGCPFGVGVNGLASTPWDIAVGGTDAYFTDYATGGASITGFWSSTNDANQGSLQTKMAEQPWDGTQFGLNSITYDPVAYQPSDTGAGGGGASSCAVGGDYYATGAVDCVSGYPKPSWQVGTGVPNDGVRDLPDVSLFASNGYNGVLWPICSEAGDCSETDPLVNETYVSGVGGTSASAPAMAGIMALINQKYGPQGQANFTLYGLAAQYPAVFNDITVGSNNEPCASYDVGYELGCAKDANDSYYSLQVYSAGVGYDQASGLGSLDVNQMITDWTKVSFKSSSTTLTLTPTTITHGQNVTASVAVTGTGTPAGAVGLVASTTLPNNKGITSLQLGAGGTASESINYLPGGTYTITGQYSGDGVNGASSSTPVTVTVNPEASTVQFQPVYVDLNTGNVSTIAANAQVPYGDDVLLDVQILGASATADGNPTGTVMFTDGSTTLSTVAVSAGGTAEFNGNLLAVGTHTISGTYSGDASYKGGTFGPLTFTVVQMPSFTDILPDVAATFNSSTQSYQYQAGQNATIDVLVGGLVSGGLYPTGNVTLQLGSAAPVTVALVPGQDLEQVQGSIAPAVFSNLQAGTYTLTATYGGDANFGSSTSTANITVVAATRLNSTSTLTVTSPSSLTNIPAGTVITLQGTVTGSGTTAPTGTVTFALENYLEFQPVAITPGTGNTSTVTFTFRAADLLGGNNTFNMNYSGDTVYAPSASSTVNVLDNNADFSVVTQTPNLAIKAGTTGTAGINLTPLNGFNGAVTLSCTAPASMVCSMSASSATVNGNGTTATLTVTASVPATTAKNHGSDWRKTGGVVLACLLLCAMPKRRRFGRMVLSLLAMSVVLGAVGCSNNSTQTTPPPVTGTNTPTGTYTVVVQGTSAAGTVHNTAVTVVVQ
jgi:hypothetical protein